MSSNRSVDPTTLAGDPIALAAQKQAHEHLKRLEERYRYEALDVEERLEGLEVRERILRLRRRMTREEM